MCGKGSRSTTSSSTSSPDPQALQAYRDILSRAQGVAATPYQGYTGELVAPINAQQTAGVNNINANAGFAAPYIGQAGTYANQAAQPITPEQIAQYQNPYTQQVVQATQNQFNNQNAQQQTALRGNAGIQGALGGNRLGVAQGTLAGQQQMAQAPVIAGLESQGYTQGVQTALAEQQAQAGAAYSLGNLGVAGQNAALSGATAQFGAGTAQQQTQQQLDAALMQQYYTQQAYPFQTTGWEAGIASGVGSQMGGTNQGVTTGPSPSPFGQFAGLGLAAAGMFANRGGRVAGFADGGAPGGMGAIPYSGVNGWVPQIQMTPHQFQTGSAPNLPGTQATDPFKQASSILGLKGKASGLFGGSDDGVTPTGPTGTSDASFPGFDDASTGMMGGIDFPIFGEKHGGRIRGYDDGGTVAGFSGSFVPDFDYAHDAFNPGVASQPPVVSDNPAFDPYRGVDPNAAPSPGFAQPANDVPLPTARPDIPSIAPTAPTAPNPIAPAVEAPDQSAGVGSTGRPPRGIRNNNPGNIEDGQFAKSQQGYVGSDGRFAQFATPQHGALAMSNLLAGYGSKGINTLSGVIKRWAPESDGNDTSAYISSVAKATGIDPNAKIDLNDPALRSKLSAAMTTVENGTTKGTAFAGNGVGGEYRNAMDADGNDVLPSGAKPTQQTGRKGLLSGLGIDLSPEAKSAMIAAGFGMMASRSPYPGVAIGEGGLKGVEQYSQGKSQAMQQSRLDLEAKRLDQQADLATKQLAQREKLAQLPYEKPTAYQQQEADLRKQQLAATEQQHKESLAEQMRQHNLGLRTPVQIGETRNGQKIYALPRPNADGTGVDYYPIDPKTQQVSPTPLGQNNPLKQQQVPGDQPGAPGVSFQPTQYTPTAEDTAMETRQVRAARPVASPEARDEDFLREIAKEDPKHAQLLKSVANYQVNPAQLFSLRGNRRERAMEDLMTYDPTYDQRRYNQTNSAIVGWQRSMEGKATRALSVTVEHLGTLEDVGRALGNGNVQAINQLKNAIKTQFGYEGPPNFEFTKQIAADEIAKAVIGGQNAEGDRQGLQAQIKASSSPEQLAGVIHRAKELMGGQIVGIERTYEQATGLHNYSDWLTPNAAREVSRIKTERDAKLAGQTLPAAGAAATASPAPITPEQRQQAIEWLKANPNDPKAAAIKQKLGIQ